MDEYLVIIGNTPDDWEEWAIKTFLEDQEESSNVDS